MSGYHCAHCHRLCHHDEQCRCEGAIAEQKVFFDQIIDRRQHVEIVCSTCQAKESIYMAPRTMRLYWMEEAKVYQNSCPDCYTAYTLQAQPYEGEV